MRNSTQTLIIILFTIINFSCEKLENIEKQEYLVHSILIEGETPKFSITKTLKTFNEYQYPFDAVYFDNVEYDSDEDFMKITHADSGIVYKDVKKTHYDIDKNKYPQTPIAFSSNYYYTLEDLSIYPNCSYKINIDIYDFNPDTGERGIVKTIQAETKIPSKVPVSINRGANKTDNENSYFTFNISFKDPENTEDYYILFVYSSFYENVDIKYSDYNLPMMNDAISHYYNSVNELFGSKFHGISSVFESENHYNHQLMLITDEKFNGQEKDIILDVQNDYITTDDYIVCDLLHLSKELFYYLYAIGKQQVTKTDVYSEPMQLYSNIENGLGIFAGASISRQIIKVEEK